MEYTYYPGCSLEASAKGYDESFRFVFQALGLKLLELEDWNCCGATYYMATKETISLVISARNLALAEPYGHDLVCPCSSCYTILYKTNHILKNNRIMKAKVDQALKKDDLKYNLGIKVRHPLEVLVNDVGLETIVSKAKVSLAGMKIAQYYGCQIVRPDRGLDDKENPQMMDSLFAALGAENVYFPMKVRCCGGMLMTTYPDVALKLNKKILENAHQNGANLVLTTCPLCQINLEAYQDKINKKFKTELHLPILFFTQALGLALGGDPKELGIQRSLIPFRTKENLLEVTK
ncbi:MAG: CoB--CoM heterodisulfide reductase iron-sulfur subunit B family protein [Candidatus Aminicenantes bacterium]|jgi:heterodisulfide reductase subunit B|nr:CoB--CoM heterodisulfide reductase iron-sulfur subunit B family protein [Candidatus Aminicenantes bacterium]MDH5467404.1 CoB--CoM heterodisulfide reductase iron-sulfur subunit B family protein [Candidatus Aminicenantes bacterium]